MAKMGLSFVLRNGLPMKLSANSLPSAAKFEIQVISFSFSVHKHQNWTVSCVKCNTNAETFSVIFCLWVVFYKLVVKTANKRNERENKTFSQVMQSKIDRAHIHAVK